MDGKAKPSAKQPPLNLESWAIFWKTPRPTRRQRLPSRRISSPLEVCVPDQLQTVFDDGVLTVSRSAEPNGDRSDQIHSSSLADAIRELTVPFREATNVHAKLKLVQVEPQTDSVSTQVYLLASGETAGGTLQINSTWQCDWSVFDSQPPRLTSIRTESYEESLYRSETQDKKMFSDCTAAVLGKNESYHQQLLHGTDHWRNRLVRDLGLDVVANHGIAIGDVNGDGLDDLYVCQQGGLPNRLYLRNPDGSAIDASASSGADWLEYCASAADRRPGQRRRPRFGRRAGVARADVVQ